MQAIKIYSMRVAMLCRLYDLKLMIRYIQKLRTG